MKLTILLLVFIAFTLFAQTDPADDFAKKTLVKVGEIAPDFTYQTLSGEKSTLSEQKGKVVVVTFFATWCPHCMKELPQIEEKIFNIFKGEKDFNLIVIGRKHDSDELEKFNLEKKFIFPLVPDPKGEIYGKYAEKYIPRVFVIGKDGKIKFVSSASPEGRIEEIYQTVKKELETKK